MPISKIRHRNSIEGDSIYHLKILMIPDPQVEPRQKERTEELMIEEFRAHMDYEVAQEIT